MNHEAAVAAFLAEAKARDPEGFAEVCRAYPILSDDQLRLRRQREVSLETLREQDG